MSQVDAIARAQEWIDAIPREMDEFHRACRERASSGRFVAFEERGRELLEWLRAQVGASVVVPEEGDVGSFFELVNAPDRPPTQYAEDSEVVVAWRLVHLADTVEARLVELADEAAEAWMRAAPAPFPGYAVLGASLKRLRREAGLSQDALATKLGVSKPQISHIETHRRGRRVPLEHVESWADACGRPLEMGFRCAAPRVLTDLADRWADLDEETRASVEAAIRDAVRRG